MGEDFTTQFPLLDRWPEPYGVPEEVPAGYGCQFLYPFRRRCAG